MRDIRIYDYRGGVLHKTIWVKHRVKSVKEALDLITAVRENKKFKDHRNNRSRDNQFVITEYFSNGKSEIVRIVNPINTEPLSRDWLYALGFMEIPHFTIGNSMTLHLSNRTILTISSLGTPNEMLAIGQVERNHDSEILNISDLVTLHNYDYDGYLTYQKLENIVRIFLQSV